MSVIVIAQRFFFVCTSSNFSEDAEKRISYLFVNFNGHCDVSKTENVAPALQQV